MCRARCGRVSERGPQRRFTTPPGRSEVASTSAHSRPGIGSLSESRTTQLLPLTITGRTCETSPRSDGLSGATTPTRPVGSGSEKSKYDEATGFTDDSSAWYLSDQPAKWTIRSIVARTSRRAAAALPPAPRSAASKAGTRLSIISAMR